MDIELRLPVFDTARRGEQSAAHHALVNRCAGTKGKVNPSLIVEEAPDLTCHAARSRIIAAVAF